ncbi:oxidoreductase [Acidaminococcus massiliensis]|jgi:NAD(P)-dependent dehydrogenase (short-subunit alcohol dehydrogenase family)|uniref:oxidoreductase n=1 Tax=Acidaminococcus massiliensis TaxID=1852375 RepID=UPI00248F3006|nr:oxidoreductase [Acidaminococcus massiliensis]
MEQQVVLVTGASSGIGRETAILLAKTGHVVYGAARRLEKLQELSKYGVIPLVLDVTKEYSCQNALQQILNQQGTLDILINNAGYGSYGAVEDVPLTEAQRQLDVNVFGAIRLTQMVLPLFRRQHRGRVIMISSIAGRLTGPFGGWYHASKYALEALSDALRMETAGQGIWVSIVEPGLVRTPWGHIAADHLAASARRGPYARLAEQAARGIHRLYDKKWLTSPAEVARTIFLAVNAAQPQARYLCGKDAYLLLALHTLLPTGLYDLAARWVMKKLA